MAGQIKFESLRDGCVDIADVYMLNMQAMIDAENERMIYEHEANKQ